MKRFHCSIIEGNKKDVNSESMKICIEVLGSEFKSKIKKGICSDVISFGNDKKSSIGVDEIRMINKDVILRPIECEYKIYIIKYAHKMTEQAQNALLKTIEEPPSYVYFLLLCDNAEKLLPTIRSRAQIIRINNKESKNKISDEQKSFVEALIKKDNLEILRISNLISNNKEKFREFLETSKILLINRINRVDDPPAHSFFVILERINKCIDLIQCNVNINLVMLSLCD